MNNPRERFDLLALCRRTIAIPSVTSQGTRQIAEFFAREVLGAVGLPARLIESPTEGSSQVNLLAVVAGTGGERGSLVLNTHLDTVAPGDSSQWTECAGQPFAATIKNGRIYGLGSADTKLDFVAKVMALIDSAPRREVFLVGTFGEEHGLVGAREMVASRLLPRSGSVFVGEPSELRLVTAHKSLSAFRITFALSGTEPDSSPPRYTLNRLIFAGRAAHSSTPAYGENAIQKALAALARERRVRVLALNGGDAVNKVPARCEVICESPSAELLRSASLAAVDESGEEELYPIPQALIAALHRFNSAMQQLCHELEPEAEEDFARPTVTSNLGLIRSDRNELKLDFEIRCPPSVALRTVAQLVSAVVDRIFGHSETYEFRLERLRANPAFRSRFDGETVTCAIQAMVRAGITPEFAVKAGCTEAGIYAEAGLEPVVFGPGPSAGVIHAPNEYNILCQVEKARQFYRQVIAA